MTAEVQIRDHVLWAAHVRGDEALRAWLESVPAGAEVELVLDGWRATWRKMADGRDGRPTAGFKPIGAAQRRWDGLQTDRGRWISIRLADEL